MGSLKDERQKVYLPDGWRQRRSAERCNARGGRSAPVFRIRHMQVGRGALSRSLGGCSRISINTGVLHWSGLRVAGIPAISKLDVRYGVKYHVVMSRPLLTTISKAHRRILEAVLRRERLRLPNFVSDLVSDLGLRAESSISRTLQRMERLGVLEIQGGGTHGRQRLLLLTPKGYALVNSKGHAQGGAAEAASRRSPSIEHSRAPSIASFPSSLSQRWLPLLGAIPAGPLQEAIPADPAASNDWVAVEEVLRSRPGDFLLRIQGDSMTGDGILEGDLVLLRPGGEVHQGGIVAVVFTGAGGDSEATLKHIYWQADGRRVPPEQAREVVLKASNPAYVDLVVPAESVRIAGVFRGLIRQGGAL